MLQSSQDLFFIIASIAVVWISVFLCWALYRLAIFLRNINSTTVELNAHIAAIDEWVNSTKERVTKSFAVVTTVTKGLETLMKTIDSRRKRSASRPRTAPSKPAGGEDASQQE